MSVFSVSHYVCIRNKKADERGGEAPRAGGGAQCVAEIGDQVACFLRRRLRE